MEKHYLFLFLTFISEIIGTVSGFGSSIMLIPLASLFFDFKNVLAITAVFHVFSNVSKLILFRKGIDKNITYKMGISAVLSVITGALLTKLINVDELEILMSITLIVLSVFMIIYFNKTFQSTDKNLYIGGTISGFLAGFIGTGGAIRGLTLAAFNLPKEIFIASSAFIDLGVDLSRSMVYVYNDYLKLDKFILIPFLVAISFIGSALGKYILRFTSEQIFRYIVLITIIVSSLIQIFRALTA